MGDIHGAHRALVQCLERVQFNKDRDTLIFLGDVADGWPDTRACVDELLTINNLVPLLGNHDWWTMHWMKTGIAESHWLSQGGEATRISYRDGVPQSHIRYFEKCRLYFRQGNRLFVHAGIDPLRPLADQDEDIFLWDRNLARITLDHRERGVSGKTSIFEEIYIGHTPVEEPIHWNGVWMMDTGAGWSGRLSMVNVDTKEITSSDSVVTLYPGIEGRKKKRRS